MQFEPLNPKKHDRSVFDCGIEALNIYLKNFANQDLKRGLTRVYVLADEANIIGYYSISAHAVKREALPENTSLGRYQDLPFLLLGRLAVDKKYQHQGYGQSLVFHACTTTIEAATKVGLLGIIVDAKDEQATAFYTKLGFKSLEATKNRLFLPISAVAKILEDC